MRRALALLLMMGLVSTAIGADTPPPPEPADFMERFEKALADPDADGATLSRINTAYLAGKQAFLTGDFPTALSLWKTGLDLARTAGMKQAEAAFEGNLGVIYDNMGRRTTALTHYQRALALDRELDDPWSLAADLGNVGVTYMNMGQYGPAAEYIEGALSLHRKLGFERGAGAHLINLGLISHKLGRYEKALSLYKQSLVIKRKDGDRRGEATALSNIGVVYHNLGQYENALEYYEKSLALHQEAGDVAGQAKDLSDIGLMRNNLGQYEKAIENYEKALDIRRRISDRAGEASNLTHLGLAHQNLGQPQAAMAYYRQALAINREIGDRLGEGRVESNLGMLYDNLSQTDKAVAHLESSLATFQELGAPESIWRAHHRLGQVKTTLGDEMAAIAHYESALDIIEDLREEMTGKETRSTYMGQKVYIYDELIELLQRLHARMPEETEFAAKALEIFERRQGRIFLEEMGNSGARRFGGIPEAVIEEELRLSQEHARIRNRLVSARMRPAGEINLAETRELEAALESTAAEQRALAERLAREYPDYHAMKYPRPIGLETLQKSVLKPGEMMLIYDIRTNGAGCWLVGRDHFSMHAIKTRHRTLEQGIKEFRAASLRLSARNVRGKLLRMSVEKAPEPPDLYPILFPESVRRSIAADPDRPDAAIEIGTGCGRSRALRKTAPGPAGTLYIVPTGPLYLLPFETLVINKPAKGSGGNPAPPPARYLVENHAIAYLTSASLLKVLREAGRRREGSGRHPLLAFANPVYQNAGEAGATRSGETIDFAPLPDTETEAREIRKILQAPATPEPLQLGMNAARSRVMDMNENGDLADYRYMVFAVHGILPGEIDRVNQPALILTTPDPKTGGNGYLTMADVFALRLNADLVALSACNTGLGEIIRGEGVMGLTRSFMYAGTPSVAVTLWSVETESIRELDVGMFLRLAGGAPPAEALRSVKMAMIHGEKGDEWRHPFYWAPMVLFGNAR